MTAQAIDHAYKYQAPSSLSREGDRRRLALATSVERGVGAQLFRGTIANPKRTVDLLLAVAGVAQSRFHLPALVLERILTAADPLITCAREQFRFESLSACSGVYARLDLLPNAVDGECLEAGTTHVDFNAPTRAALSGLREQDRVELEVGAALGGRSEAVERKVKLPARWIRGFTEVQATQAAMKPRFELPGAEFRRFLRELRRGLKGIPWIRSAGAGLRVSQTQEKGAVAAGGIARLRVLEPAAHHFTRCRVYGQSHGGSTAWELATPDSRLHLVLSPDVWLGFSGESRLLATLARNVREKAIGVVRASLQWQRRIDSEALADEAGLGVSAIEWALSRCAASGLVGYDLAAGGYFHRELPFDLSLV